MKVSQLGGWGVSGFSGVEKWRTRATDSREREEEARKAESIVTRRRRRTRNCKQMVRKFNFALCNSDFYFRKPSGDGSASACLLSPSSNGRTSFTSLPAPVLTVCSSPTHSTTPFSSETVRYSPSIQTNQCIDTFQASSWRPSSRVPLPLASASTPVLQSSTIAGTRVYVHQALHLPTDIRNIPFFSRNNGRISATNMLKSPESNATLPLPFGAQTKLRCRPTFG